MHEIPRVAAMTSQPPQTNSQLVEDVTIHKIVYPRRFPSANSFVIFEEWPQPQRATRTFKGFFNDFYLGGAYSAYEFSLWVQPDPASRPGKPTLLIDAKRPVRFKRRPLTRMLLTEIMARDLGVSIELARTRTDDILRDLEEEYGAEAVFPDGNTIAPAMLACHRRAEKLLRVSGYFNDASDGAYRFLYRWLGPSMHFLYPKSELMELAYCLRNSAFPLFFDGTKNTSAPRIPASLLDFYGHCFRPLPERRAAAVRSYGAFMDKLEQRSDTMMGAGEAQTLLKDSYRYLVRKDALVEQFAPCPTDRTRSGPYVYDRAMHNHETAVIDLVYRLSSFSARSGLCPDRERLARDVMALPESLLDASQKMAIAKCVRGNLLLITGRPGSGKSHTTSVLAHVLQRNLGYQVLVVSFTGAAVRNCREKIRKTSLAGFPSGSYVTEPGKERMVPAGTKRRHEPDSEDEVPSDDEADLEPRGDGALSVPELDFQVTADVQAFLTDLGASASRDPEGVAIQRAVDAQLAELVHGDEDDRIGPPDPEPVALTREELRRAMRSRVSATGSGPQKERRPPTVDGLMPHLETLHSDGYLLVDPHEAERDEAEDGIRCRTMHSVIHAARASDRGGHLNSVDYPFFDVDAVIVDEGSMVPLWLLAQTLALLPSLDLLVIAGDMNQILPIEPGCVAQSLQDRFRADAVAGPVDEGRYFCELRKNHRVSEEGLAMRFNLDLMLTRNGDKGAYRDLGTRVLVEGAEPPKPRGTWIHLEAGTDDDWARQLRYVYEQHRKRRGRTYVLDLMIVAFRRVHVEYINLLVYSWMFPNLLPEAELPRLEKLEEEVVAKKTVSAEEPAESARRFVPFCRGVPLRFTKKVKSGPYLYVNGDVEVIGGLLEIEESAPRKDRRDEKERRERPRMTFHTMSRMDSPKQWDTTVLVFQSGRFLLLRDCEKSGLTLGYAITISAAQGSEAPNVCFVMPVRAQLNRMCSNRHAYTVASRAQSRFYLIGPWETFADAIRREESGRTNCALKDLLHFRYQNHTDVLDPRTLTFRERHPEREY